MKRIFKRLLRLLKAGLAAFEVYIAARIALNIGLPTASILYDWQAAKRNWRGMLAVLLIIAAVLSILGTVFSNTKAKQLPTADEFFGPPPTVAH